MNKLATIPILLTITLAVLAISAMPKHDIHTVVVANLDDQHPPCPDDCLPLPVPTPAPPPPWPYCGPGVPLPCIDYPPPPPDSKRHHATAGQPFSTPTNGL